MLNKIASKYLEKVADTYTVNGKAVTDKGEQHLMRLESNRDMNDNHYIARNGTPNWMNLRAQNYTPKQMNIYNKYYTQQLKNNIRDPRFDNNLSAAQSWALQQTNRYMHQKHNIGSPTDWTDPVTDDMLSSWGYSDSLTKNVNKRNTTNSNGVKEGEWSRF